MSRPAVPPPAGEEESGRDSRARRPPRRRDTRIERELRRKVGQAIGDFRLLDEGDRVLVALSGGKDSLALLDILLKLQRKAPVRYELVPFTVDGGFTGFDGEALRRQVEALGLPLEIASKPIAAVLRDKQAELDIACSLCSRLRRGALYEAAPRLGCNKIALGHHADDLIETLLLNLFFTGELRAMAPIMRAEDGRNLVIRPLCYAFESEIEAYCRSRGFPPNQAVCPESRIHEKRRRWAKGLLQELERQVPRLKNSALAALGNLRESFFLDPRFLP